MLTDLVSELVLEKFWNGYATFRDLIHGDIYVPIEKETEEAVFELHSVYVDFSNMASGHVGPGYGNDYLRPIVLDNPELLALCIRQELEDPHTPNALIEELERVLNLGCPLAFLIQHGMAIPTAEGIDHMVETWRTIQHCKAIQKRHPHMPANKVLSLQWDEYHRSICDGCEFSVHNEI